MTMIDRDSATQRCLDIRWHTTAERRVVKKLAARTSRHYGARRAVAWGLEEARDLLPAAAWATTLILFKALWVRQKAKEVYASEAYYTSFGESTLLGDWTAYVQWVEDEI